MKKDVKPVIQTMSEEELNSMKDRLKHFENEALLANVKILNTTMTSMVEKLDQNNALLYGIMEMIENVANNSGVCTHDHGSDDEDSDDEDSVEMSEEEKKHEIN